jgi:hypothetical protein
VAAWSAADEVLGVAGAAWFDSTAVVLELAAVLWFEFMSLEGVVVVAGAAAAGAALLSAVVALVCEVTGGVELLAVAAALLPGLFWSAVEVAGAAEEAELFEFEL